MRTWLHYEMEVGLSLPKNFLEKIEGMFYFPCGDLDRPLAKVQAPAITRSALRKEMFLSLPIHSGSVCQGFLIPCHSTLLLLTIKNKVPPFLWQSVPFSVWHCCIFIVCFGPFLPAKQNNILWKFLISQSLWLQKAGCSKNSQSALLSEQFRRHCGFEQALSTWL